MFILGECKEPYDEVLLEVIRILCTEMNRDDISDGFHSHTEEAGRRVMEYLWRIGAMKAVKEPLGQMSIHDLMDGRRNE